MHLPGIVSSANGRSFTFNEPTIVVDLRPTEDFVKGHLPGSCSLPFDELERCMWQLPPPGEWNLALVGREKELQRACDLLRPKGWNPDVRDADDPAVFRTEQVESGSSMAQSWRPNSFLHAVVHAMPLRYSQHSGLAVDLGCGGGRDAVFLAQHFRERTRWSVCGIDNHRGALQRGRDLALAASTDVHFEAANLRRGGLQAYMKQHGKPLRFVHGCRFLDTALIEQLPLLLAPGGIVVWSTFLDGCEALAPPFKASRRLSRGQLRSVLGEASGFNVLHESEGELLTRGQWVPAQFYAAELGDTDI